MGIEAKDRDWALRIFLGPALVMFTVFLLCPLIFCVVLSVSNASVATLGNGSATFIGLDNYIALSADSGFWQACWRFCAFAGATTTIELALALAVSFYLDQVLKVPKIVETLLVLPMFVIPIVSGLVFRYLVDPSDGINYSLFGLFGREAPDMLGDSSLAFVTIILQDVWRMWPFLFLIIYAGIKSLPREPVEAAKMDGATAWESCRYVILPMLRPTLIVAAVLKAVESLKAFTEIFVMTGGGPGSSTEVLSLFIVKQAFVFFKLGYAAAASTVVLALGALAAGIILILQNRRAATA